MNLLSILLGVGALVFAVHALRVRGCLICCTASLGLCGGALVCQLYELYRLTLIGDTAAVYDTAHARFLAGSILLVLTLGIHLMALLSGKNRKQGG